MHCERCGSADTEIIKCKECGQKSRVRCTNCNFSHCTDKYCSVISIKRTVKRLTALAIFLVVAMMGMIPFVWKTFKKNQKKKKRGGRKTATSKPKPTRKPTRKPTKRPPATKPTRKPPTVRPKPNGTDEPDFDPELFGGSQTFDDKMKAAIRKALKKPYKRKGNSPETGFSYVGLPYWLFKEAGRPIPASFRSMSKLKKRLTTKDWKKFKRGDLLFFSISKRRGGKVVPNFVAVYNAGGKFVCAHPKAKKVILTGFVAKRVGKWWKKKFLYAIRYEN